MRHIDKYKNFSNYRVFINWEHGSADLKTQEFYNFKTEDEMIEFLNFIYDIRKFVPNTAYENQGYFEDGHYQRERKWVEKVDQKYENKFSNMIPDDRYYRSSDYRPKIEDIHVEIGGNIYNIVWKSAIKTNIISLPKIGDEIEVSIGRINGSSLGLESFGGKSDDYFDYIDFEHKEMNVDEGEYDTIKCNVIDCVIDESYRKYERKEYNHDKEFVTKRYNTYCDYVSFCYNILCTFGPTTFNKKIVTQMHGYDTKFELKYHRNLGDLYFI